MDSSTESNLRIPWSIFSVVEVFMYDRPGTKRYSDQCSFQVCKADTMWKRQNCVQAATSKHTATTEGHRDPDTTARCAGRVAAQRRTEFQHSAMFGFAPSRP